MRISATLLILFITITAIAQQKNYYVPDLLYSENWKPNNTKIIKCFDENEQRSSYLKPFSYCLEYQISGNDTIPVKRIERSDDHWFVTDIATSEQIKYIEDREVIVEMDEIQTMTFEMEPFTYRIYYYKTEAE